MTNRERARRLRALRELAGLKGGPVELAIKMEVAGYQDRYREKTLRNYEDEGYEPKESITDKLETIARVCGLPDFFDLDIGVDITTLNPPPEVLARREEQERRRKQARKGRANREPSVPKPGRIAPGHDEQETAEEGQRRPA